MFDKTPKYDIDLEEFETSEPNHADVFNKRIEKIIHSLGWMKENVLTKAHIVQSTEIQEDGCLIDGKTLSMYLKNLVSSWENKLTEGLKKKVDCIEGRGLSENDFTNALKEKLDNISAAANKYIHPKHKKYASGLYKVEVDGEGHIVSASLVTKEDITELGIPGQDTNTTYGLVSTETAGLAPRRTGTATKYLRDDGVWATPPDTDTTYGLVSTEAAGLAPRRTGTVTKFLRDDGIWETPPDTKYDIVSINEAGLVPKREGSTKKYFRDDGIWEIPPNTEYGTGNEEEEGIGKLYSKIGKNTDGSMTQKAISEEFAKLNGKITDTDIALSINNSYLTATFRRVGPTVQYSINVLKNLPLSTSITLYTLPEEYRPILTFYTQFGNPGSVPNIRLGINEEGRITAYLYNNNGYGNAMASGSYVRKNLY